MTRQKTEAPNVPPQPYEVPVAGDRSTEPPFKTNEVQHVSLGNVDAKHVHGIYKYFRRFTRSPCLPYQSKLPVRVTNAFVLPETVCAFTRQIEQFALGHQVRTSQS